MYKLLTRGIATNGVVNWSYYKKLGQEFATNNITKAKEQYRELLEHYGISNINLVNVITPDIIIDIIDDTEVEDYIIPIVSTDLYNGTDMFVLQIIIDDDNYMWVDYNTAIFEDFKTYLESMGLVNVEINIVDGSITGDTEGMPIGGFYEIPAGLFIAYDRVNKTISNVSEKFTFSYSIE